MTSKKTQTDAVVEVMERNGGFATLRHLYDNVLHVKDVAWETRTPFATMRRIVQNPAVFFKIKPGLWALNSARNRLPTAVVALIGRPGRVAQDDERSTHYYYQGIAVEVGNMQDYRTYVPAHDRNRPFLNRKLSDVAATCEMPQFTYPSITNRVKGVDVIWFNNRGLPHSVFEVEHSTDFKNSLAKFHELLEFNTAMTILAPDSRRPQFEDVVSMAIYAPAKERVAFWSYGYLERIHATLSEEVAERRLATSSRR